MLVNKGLLSLTKFHKLLTDWLSSCNARDDTALFIHIYFEEHLFEAHTTTIPTWLHMSCACPTSEITAVIYICRYCNFWCDIYCNYCSVISCNFCSMTCCKCNDFIFYDTKFRKIMFSHCRIAIQSNSNSNSNNFPSGCI